MYKQVLITYQTSQDFTFLGLKTVGFSIYRNIQVLTPPSKDLVSLQGNMNTLTISLIYFLLSITLAADFSASQILFQVFVSLSVSLCRTSVFLGADDHGFNWESSNKRRMVQLFKTFCTLTGYFRDYTCLASSAMLFHVKVFTCPKTLLNLSVVQTTFV